VRTYLVDEKALRIRRWHVLEAGSATQRRQGACLLLSSRDHARRPTASGPAALPNLEELNTTPIDRWQRSIEAIEEDGRACQRRLFSDVGGPDSAEGGGRLRGGALKPGDVSTADSGRVLAGMPIVGGIRFGPELSGIGAVRWNGQRRSSSWPSTGPALRTAS
jgi:hypothetical protein